MITQKIVTKGDDDGSWFTIEYAEHSGEIGFRHIPEWGGMGLFYAGRISDADVEGNKDEMIALAKAVLAGEDESFKRCAVEMGDGFVEFSSPRNSQRPAKVAIDVAKAWAAETLEKLGTP